MNTDVPTLHLKKESWNFIPIPLSLLPLTHRGNLILDVCIISTFIYF